MATATLLYRPPGIWRFSHRDAWFVVLAALHGAVLLLVPAAPVIAIGLWWNANTIAHNFIHRPFFRSEAANAVLSAALSLLLGIPQTLWRDRHLAHHAEVEWRLRLSRRLVFEAALVAMLWIALAWARPQFFVSAYLPGYCIGLGLCWMQGHWEHASGEATSHYGRIYNFLCFNDGYHAEHHADPSRHWSRLADRVLPAAASSRWPALFRWIEVPPLEILERLVLRSRLLRRFVLRTHRGPFRALLAELPPVQEVGIVGGGLYPRTALILHELLPEAQLTVIDASARNLETAQRHLAPAATRFRHERFAAGDAAGFDLLVIPLCFDGDREAIYRHPPSPAVLVHDWIWRRRGTGAVVSCLLLKRVNLVRA